MPADQFAVAFAFTDPVSVGLDVAAALRVSDPSDFRLAQRGTETQRAGGVARARWNPTDCWCHEASGCWADRDDSPAGIADGSGTFPSRYGSC